MQLLDMNEYYQIAKNRLLQEEALELLLEGDLISHLWGDSKDRLYIPIMNEKNRQTYYGALNLANPELILEKYPKGQGEYTVDFVKQLMAKNPGKKLLLFWDGAAYHLIGAKQ